ncbi:hypothetical protein GCM10009548_21490 [Streptomyces malaysiensis subsp. malaysiensis]
MHLTIPRVSVIAAGVCLTISEPCPITETVVISLRAEVSPGLVVSAEAVVPPAMSPRPAHVTVIAQASETALIL